MKKVPRALLLLLAGLSGCAGLAPQDDVKAPAGLSGAMTAGAVFRECAGCPEMVVVPSGRFWMGSPETEKGRWSDEGPRRQVSVKRFAIGRYELKRGEFARFVEATKYETDAERDNGCRGLVKNRWDERVKEYDWRRTGFEQTDEHPVVCVSWNDANAYVAWLNSITGAAGAYRLLSSAEWEYAARAGTETSWHFGDDWTKLPEYAWYSLNAERRTHPVGEKKPNPLGLFDMYGNVWEWVADSAYRNYEGMPTDGSAWVAPEERRKTLRSSSWVEDAKDTRSSTLDRHFPVSRYNYIGFRVARSLPAE